MFGPSTWRIPVATLTAGILLCGCSAAASSNGTGGPSGGSSPSATGAPSSPGSRDAAAPAMPGNGVLPVLTVPGGVAAAAAVKSPTTPARPKVVYLTFDDGPSEYTPQVMALLDKYDAKATFFVIGKQVGHAKKTLHAQYAAGHGVANHTWDHQSLRGKSPRQFRNEVYRTSQVIRDATGHMPICLRPPGGARDKNTAKRAKAYGMKLKLWSVDTYDWKRPGKKAIIARATHIHDGAVVLMHDGGGDRRQTVAALDTILKDLKAKGFTFRAMCR